MTKLNYKFVSALLFFIIIGLSGILIKNNLQSLASLLSTFGQNTESIFYIGWGDGTFARSTKDTKQDPVFSFKEPITVKLPYSNAEELPDWIDMSNYCGKQCFVSKSAFSTDPDTSAIIADWEDRTALTLCQDNMPFDPGGSSSYGSGLLTWSENQPAIITAKHVIEQKKLCQIYIPKHGYKEIDANSFKKHEVLDLAIILLGEYNSVQDLSKEPINVCDNALNGEEIKFLGYPEQIIPRIIKGEINTPSNDGGAISNQTIDKYLLSDDIGHGYSGGIAIKKKSGCYLGVPIGVEQGTDRIGDTGIILKATNLKYNVTTGFNL